ncbi:unnamed protein product [Prunus armeniaca]|uniref:Uncharacterized protein n=1 Tax=Prunus armeniaca TaxID=36596 RepID=A0A6J5VKA7_PRUAR|nr:unnamed protein product [Prunus armeniaca]
MVKQTLGRAIQLADQVAKALDRAVVRSTDKSFIPKLKSKAEQLAGLLRQLSSIDLGTYPPRTCDHRQRRTRPR